MMLGSAEGFKRAPLAASADGSIVVGQDSDCFGAFESCAFIWDAVRDYRTITRECSSDVYAG